MLSGLANWVIGVIESTSYWGLAGLVALENVFPPIPSEIILPMGGFLTGQGRLNYGLAVGAATVGSVLGAIVLYEVGRQLGEDRMRRFIERRGKWMLVSVQDYEKAEAWFERHGPTAVLLGRCAPGVRSFISIPAGIQRMALPKFILFTAIGSGVYNAVLIGLGWLLGNNWQRVSKFTGGIETILWVMLAAVIVYWIVKKTRQRGQHA